MSELGMDSECNGMFINVANLGAILVGSCRTPTSNDDDTATFVRCRTQTLSRFQFNTGSQSTASGDRIWQTKEARPVIKTLNSS